MSEVIYKDLNEFLESQEITIVDSFQYVPAADFNNISDNRALEHLKIIGEFHEKVKGFTGYLGKRLNNSTGKKIEDFKVYLKKFKRDIHKLEETGSSNSFEELMLEFGEKYAGRAEKCLDIIYKAGYYELISRSMKNVEICLGDTWHTNLRKGETLEIIDLKHCSYNMVECDGAYYIGKLKRNGVSLEWEKLIKNFCEYEKLNSSSEAFIKAVVSYPYEVMRCYNRYKYGKKDWSEQEYELRLRAAFLKDGESII